MKSKSTAIVFALIALLAGLAVSSIIWGPRPAKLQSGSLLSPPRAIPEFAPMTADDGSAFTRSSLDGHWSLLYPGYTHCPDVCPTTLALLAVLTRTRAQARHPVRIVFLSIDPARDTPQRLRSYVHAFNPGFIGITAQEPVLAAFCRIFGIAYAKETDAGTAQYTMDHSSTLILIDPKGRIAAYFSPPFELQTLGADLKAALSAD
ncbi:MAG: SCO family protein [Stenotrophobium sp.]